MAFLYELQSQLETMKSETIRHGKSSPEHLEVIHTNLPIITEYCGMEPYRGDDSYEQLSAYMSRAEDILSKRSNQITLKMDAQVARYIHQYGKEALIQLKRDNYNTKLEDCVIGADQPSMVEVVDNYIVPRKGLIFLTPRNQCGRAPFYSSEKVVGSWHVKTLWFNLSVLLLMCVIVTILLLTDCPGRYIRKENNG